MYGEYWSLDDAKGACASDEDCGMIYDNKCDLKEAFQLCNKTTKRSKSGKGSCVYVKDVIESGNF